MGNIPGQLFEQTLQRFVTPSAHVVHIEELPSGSQGYSGSNVRHFAVAYKDARGDCRSTRLVTKDAPLLERRILAYLSNQGHAHIPFSSTLDLTTDAPALVCQRYIGVPEPSSAHVMTQAAQGLARIHQANMGRDAELAWLPRADRAFFDGSYVLGNWWNEWTQTMADPQFAQEFGAFTGRLQAAAAHFLREMDAIWDDGRSLTLVHGDLHVGNVLADHDMPYFIDWEHARYGSLYLDLPNYFAPEHLPMYRGALAELGYAIPADELIQGYHEASRYVGFKYLGFWLQHWRRGGDDRTLSRAPLAALIATAIEGRPVH
ncbi:MAG TPA: aminoglycoside phosphotransferase family protein [Herpetosiphonaceae bacterium]|nr:aminoglycoside phosphotransferase family protein [Herpetosiphonaceae bacterium]